MLNNRKRKAEHKAEIDFLNSKIELLKAQLRHEKYLTAIERERYKKVVIFNNRLIGKNLQFRDIVTKVAPELGACVN